ncbi:TPA: hypothetical protein ACV4T7_003949, partial [Burkholderia ambifaria]
PVAVPVHALADQTLDVVREFFVELHRALPAGLRMRAAVPCASDTRVCCPPTGLSFCLIAPSGFAFSIAVAHF